MCTSSHFCQPFLDLAYLQIIIFSKAIYIFFACALNDVILFISLHCSSNVLYFKYHVYYILLHLHHLISTVVPSSSSSSFVGFFFGSSIRSTPLLILALTLEDTISSGIGILR